MGKKYESTAMRKGFVERCGVPFIIVTWYTCSIVGNNAGKQLLPTFPFPYTLSMLQFAMGTASVPLALLLGGKPVRHLWGIARTYCLRGLVLGVAGFAGNFFQRVALVYITVSFTHTVKATQPLFTAALSFTLLRQRFSYRTLGALVIIALGVALAALSEFHFNLTGFLAAAASACAMSVGNTFMKCFMNRKKPGRGGGGGGIGGGGSSPPASPRPSSETSSEGRSTEAYLVSRRQVIGSRAASEDADLEGQPPPPPPAAKGEAEGDPPLSPAGAVREKLEMLSGPYAGPGEVGGLPTLDKNELFFLANLYSLLLMVPLWWRVDGRRLLAAFGPPNAARLAGAAALDGAAPAEALAPGVFLMALASTAPMVLQHFVSIAMLSMITPVSHSVVNACKRVVVISVSVVYFRNPVSGTNLFGMACALGGVFLYQRSLALELALEDANQVLGSGSQLDGTSGGGSGGEAKINGGHESSHESPPPLPESSRSYDLPRDLPCGAAAGGAHSVALCAPRSAVKGDAGGKGGAKEVVWTHAANKRFEEP
eukprot:CAMPEP_0172647060 /NCGR_PEP_ID=MMETSP1068-20121228/240557_1 /TAXON_ID=35684 /ORGANISM="Pseudopedinella elastica, Strain CCMP716" /LENGTH=540 /DNA_ID=CAMNT_0013461333 /DNA_START=732 /DNA_END=2354 /DNA_ORIENTATION=-